MSTAYVPYCHVCTYDISGLPTQRCPECGEQFDLDAQQAQWEDLHQRMEKWGGRLVFPGLATVLIWFGFAVVAGASSSSRDSGQIAMVLTLVGMAVLVVAFINSLINCAEVSGEISLLQALRNRQSTDRRHRLRTQLFYFFLGFVVFGCLIVFAGFFAVMMGFAIGDGIVRDLIQVLAHLF